MPETADALSLVHRGWEHLQLQRPLAAWASWQKALRKAPGDQAAREALDVLASAPDLPLAARAPYRFRSPTDEATRDRWAESFEGKDLQDLDRAADAFADLVMEDETDGAALFNLALCLAWAGRNPEAVGALDLAVSAEAVALPEAAVTSWTLAEVLRQGAGAEDLADDLNYSLSLPWTPDRGEPIAWLSRFAPVREIAPPADPNTGRPAVTEARVGEWLDRPLLLDGPTARVVASIIATPKLLRLSSPDRRSLEEVEAVLTHHGTGEFQKRSSPLPLPLLDASVFLFRLPEGAEPSEGRERQAIETYYEDRWITIPRRGLDGLSPAGAARTSAEDPVLRAKLTAVVNLREGLAERPRMVALYQGYPFDRLRRRLGLAVRDESTIDPEDIAGMGLADLAKLDPETLPEPDLSAAEWSSRVLSDEEMASKFAAEIARRRGVGP